MQRQVAVTVLLSWLQLSSQESADKVPFHGFLPKYKLRAYPPPGDGRPNDIYYGWRTKPPAVADGWELRYPNYKLSLDVPKDPEHSVYVFTWKAEAEAASERRRHRHRDGRGRRYEGRPATGNDIATPMVPPSVATMVLPSSARPTRRPLPVVRASPSRLHFRPAVAPTSASGARRPRPSSAPPRRPQAPPTVQSLLRRPAPAPPTVRSRGASPPAPSVSARLKADRGRYPPEQYRVFPGGFIRLSTYTTLSG